MASIPHRQNIGLELTVVALVFFPLALIAVCLRLFVRLWIVRAAGWDDWHIVLAVVERVSST